MTTSTASFWLKVKVTDAQLGVAIAALHRIGIVKDWPVEITFIDEVIVDDPLLKSGLPEETGVEKVLKHIGVTGLDPDGSAPPWGLTNGSMKRKSAKAHHQKASLSKKK